MMYKILNRNQIDKLKTLIIDNVVMNPNVILNNDNLADDGDPNPDVIDIVVGMFEYIYQLSTGSEYDYMWHYANKVGSWCWTDYLYNWLTKEVENGKD